jgi:hemerythrin superfamily protein
MLHAANPAPSSSGHILGQHHLEIEEACLALLDACCTGDPRKIARSWREFEFQLYDHMMAEEHFLFPVYQQDEPENTQELRDQHARLRELVVELGVALQLRTIHLAQIEAFVAALRDHEEREDASLYRWADRHLADDECHQMRDYLAAS